MNSDRPLNSRQACELLGSLTRADGKPVSRRTLTRYKSKGLPFVAVIPNVYREPDLKRWLDGRKKGVWI